MYLLSCIVVAGTALALAILIWRLLSRRGRDLRAAAVLRERLRSSGPNQRLTAGTNWISGHARAREGDVDDRAALIDGDIEEVREGRRSASYAEKRRAIQTRRFDLDTASGERISINLNAYDWTVKADGSQESFWGERRTRFQLHPDQRIAIRGALVAKKRKSDESDTETRYRFNKGLPLEIVVEGADRAYQGLFWRPLGLTVVAGLAVAFGLGITARLAFVEAYAAETNVVASTKMHKERTSSSKYGPKRTVEVRRLDIAFTTERGQSHVCNALAPDEVVDGQPITLRYSTLDLEHCYAKGHFDVGLGWGVAHMCAALIALAFAAGVAMQSARPWFEEVRAGGFARARREEENQQ